MSRKKTPPAYCRWDQLRNPSVKQIIPDGPAEQFKADPWINRSTPFCALSDIVYTRKQYKMRQETIKPTLRFAYYLHF